MSAKFQGMKIGLASPETILKWSKGEVTKPETVNYKTIKPEKDGLFCQKIFGPEKDYECACGKYKKIKNKGKVCERCGVEITESIVRRERMGHVKLACPITHTWLLFKRDRIISRILNIKQKNLEKIVYFQAHVVLNQPEIDYPSHVVEKERIHHRDVLEFTGEENEIVLQSRKKTMHILLVIMKKHEVTSEAYAEARRYYELISNHQIPTFSIDQIMNFVERETGLKTGTGSEAILSLLEELDGQKIATEIATIKNQISSSLSPTTRTTSRFDLNKLKRLKILNAFDQKPNSQRRNMASWMILRVLPVIPPDLRPIIQLDGGRFTTSDLNNLYRRIIIRNERLKKLQTQRAPSIIVNNEKRLLQEAVDALFDNGHLAKTKKVKGREGRPLKSLADLLAGKEGRFRQNLLGKRVDYSGRSVIVVGPELKMYQCGLPAEMAITLFRPFLLNRLITSEIAKNIKVAEHMIEVQDTRIWPIVNQIAKERPVLLNRAPTLHRLGIQAFEPKIINSKAIRLHPLVCTAFNADFDGDQMAVHVPISDEAVAEARSIMLASWHILSPKDGQPIVAPSLDMVLGLYYLTLEVKGKRGEGMIFRDAAEAIIAHQADQVDIHAIVAVATRSYWHKGMPSNQYIITSLGKILLNESLPKDFPYVTDKELAAEVNPRYLVKGGEDVRTAIANYQPGPALKKADIGRLVKKVNDVHQVAVVAQFLDKLKDLGFKYSTKSGVTFSIFDIPAIPGKITQVESLENFIVDVRRLFRQGKVTQWERFRLINDKWFETRRYFEKEIVKIFEQNKTNPIVMMADSGARSNISNFMQLAGLRGLMLNAQGETIEIPIKSSFIDGLTISEVFISTFGARKGMTDIALNTSRSGFLTRRFIDGSQDIIVKENDCGTPFGLMVSDFYDQSNTLIETFKERVLGRYLVEDLRDSRDRVLISADEMITEQNFARIELAKVKSVVIRSPVHCRAERGICQKCYGLDLSTNARVEVGTPVGILASQSLGEPSTQLTMRTFHGGGIKSGSDISQGLEEVIKVFDAVTGLKDINYDKYVQYNTTNLRRHKNNPQVYIDLMEFITKSLKSFIVVKGNREIQWSKFSYIYGKVSRIRKFNYTPQLVSELWSLENPRAKSNKILQNIKIHVDDQLLNREFFEITVRNNMEEQRYYTFDHVVKEGDFLEPGSALSKGRVVWDLLTKIAGVNKVVEQLHAIPQRIYKLNGIDVCDKYMEIMIKKMTGYMIVVNPSPESNVLPGSNISVTEFKRINKQLLLNNQKPIYGIPTIVGLLWTWEYAKEKFFSAMSFIYTSLVLVDAAINEHVDPMEGIKENVALGDLIPVGTALLTADQVKQNGDYWIEQQY